VVDELLARLPHLAGVGFRGKVERPGQELPVNVRLVGLDLGEQLVDEVDVGRVLPHIQCIPGRSGALSRSSAPIKEEFTFCR
jgi:hypothetical protein